MPVTQISRRTVIKGAAGAALVLPMTGRLSAQSRRPLTFWFEGATPEQQASLDRNLVQPYNASQSEFELQVEYRGSAVADQLMISLSANEGPDIVLTNGPSWTRRFVGGGRLASLDDYAAKYGWREKLAGFPVELSTIDGTLYALPKTQEVQAIFYNKTLFDEHGYKAPTTRAEFEAIADDMLTKDIIPIAAGNSGARYTNRHYVSVAWNAYCGPQAVFEGLSGKRPWNDETFVEAINMTTGWWKKGYFGGDKYFAVNPEQAFTLMANGVYGMAMQGTWAIAWVNDSFAVSEQEMAYTPIPRWSDAAPYPVFPYGVGSNLGINAASENKDAAAAVLNMMLDPTFVANISDGWEGEWDIPLLEAGPKPEGTYAILARQIRDDTTRALAEETYGYTPWAFWPPKTDDYMKGGIEEVWLGSSTAKEFCDNVNTIFQEELAAGTVSIPPARG